MFNKGGISQMMQQMQKMQEKLQQAQDKLVLLEVTGEAGAGMVKIMMTCSNDVKKVEIDPSVMDDKEMLEDLIVAAYNDATRKAKEVSQSEMGGLTAGIPLPPGFNPFGQ